jgi:NAD(P)-dependent dehydrogenase (short-subunit alcohol dehydrogenase family)
MQFAVNHLGHFLLANLLLDIMKNSGSARIVSVSSNLHSWGSIYWDDLNAKKNYSYGFRYNQSKLANVLFTRELQRRLQEEGSDVAAYAIHPGVIRTDLQRHAPGFIRFLFSTVGKLFMKSLEQGAATTLYATVHPQAQGLYFADCAPAKPGKNTKNAEDAKRLWEVSEEMVDLKGALAEVLHAAGSNMKERKKEKKTKKSTKKQEDASQ